MLKIKDNVDLKELEKYGFHKDIYSLVYLYKQNNFTGIRVEIETLKIGVINNADIVIEKETLDILYDLIQAGLVEKVGEDNE